MLVIWNTDLLLLQLTSNELICVFVRMHHGLQRQVVHNCVYNLSFHVRICACTYGLPEIHLERPRTCIYTSSWRLNLQWTLILGLVGVNMVISETSENLFNLLKNHNFFFGVEPLSHSPQADKTTTTPYGYSYHFEIEVFKIGRS